MKIWYRLIVALFIALVLDSLTKIWAEQSLELYQPVPVIGQFFRLMLGYNTGVAFSLLAGGGYWPLIITGIIIVGLTIWLIGSLRSGELPTRASWPIGLLLGGAMANFVDRLPDGRVTDFLDVGLGAIRWPTFNLADSFITLGLVYFMLISFNNPSQTANAEQPGAPSLDSNC